MTHLRYVLGSLACWIAFTSTLVPLLRGYRRDPALVAMCAAFGCQGMYLALSVPSRWTGSLFGQVTWYNVSVQMWIIATITCQQLLLILWTHPRPEARIRCRRRLITLAFVPATMTVLYFLATRYGHPRNYFERPGDQPFLVAYLVTFLSAFVVGKVAVARACRFYARLSEDPWVRRGLRIAACGAAVELVYPTGRFADVFLVPYGWHPARWANVSRTDLTVGMVLNIVGWTAPLWGPRLTAILEWHADYRSYRRLRPLWSALYRAYPEISLEPPGGDLTALSDLTFHLHRRVIEIRDGYLALRKDAALAPPFAATDSSGQPEAEREAALIAAALAGRQRRHDPPDADTAIAPIGPESQDFADDVAWLVRVSQAYARANR
ncbi:MULTISPECIES: MAB_1171c family putative transporter [Streptomyces]|uniref:MAB_1171c family putative transporter n=1 Tax=Streptomyces TaxID=1883 RepID=UPI00068C867E|nr:MULTISPECIES: MAB_1171c family putative transporter [Streptomyces]